MSRPWKLVSLPLALVIGCSGDPGPASLDAAAVDELKCPEFCGAQDLCLGTNNGCVSACAVAPELPTDACSEAYRARNTCVSQLACADLIRWSNKEGAPPPCAAQEAAITDACGS